MQKLQDSVFSIIKATNLSPAVFSFLQPTDEYNDKTPLGGILRDTRHGWLALGPKFCVIDLKSGLKVAARAFGNGLSSRTSVTSVTELPTPLTDNSQQLLISLDCDDAASMICVFHVNGSQLLHCIQADVVITELVACDAIPSGPFTCFDGLVTAGTKRGEVFVFDLNRNCLLEALKNITQGYEEELHNEKNAANLVFLPLQEVHKIETQRDMAVDNNDHLAVLLNETSMVDGQYIFRNPDGTVRMKANRDHIRVTVVQYIPQIASVAVGFNFGAFQIWNLLNMELEFTSQVNVECLPVTHFGFQEPCDDPRAFCYLWVVFSVIDRFEEEEFPLAVMYSLTYQGKRILTENTCLYQEFSMATIRFQVELSAIEDANHLVGGRCISCHTYSVDSTLGDEGEDSMLNLCQLVWECWGENAKAGTQHGMLLFDLDQWYKDQMPARGTASSSAYASAAWCGRAAGSAGSSALLAARLDPASVAAYSHATRLEEHFYPNSLQYKCMWLSTSEALALQTAGVQRQLLAHVAASGPACLLAPARLRAACAAAGLAPLYRDPCADDSDPEEQRRYLLSVALEARLSGFLKRCARDWATGTHSGAGCTLPFFVDWCWKRAIELKENATELTAPLFTSSTLPDRNVVRCLEHCVQQLTQLTGLLDAILTKCCNLIVPDALSELEERHKGISTVAQYFQVVQWLLRAALLPERHDACALPYPAHRLHHIYAKRRLKLQRLEDKGLDNEQKSCSLLYIDQLIENEFGGEKTHQMWIRAGSENGGLYPPPSLYALLRLYLRPDVPDEHKHALVLYLLLDYSMLYDDVRYEEVIRRLMQFPTMFGLSNTAIKATQAFWHLDHRDFDFALDQLQCLTGNTLSDWQHNVVLSSLLAQKKTQAALQYLHVRKPAPIQNLRDKDTSYNRLNDNDKLDDWQSCCNLYLARGLVFEALDVIRMCVQNAGSVEDRVHVLNFFFKGCRNTGQLSKILQVTFTTFEEEVFVKYLKDCNESQTSDILIMYYLQNARYLEAQQYNKKIKAKGRSKDMSTSAESLLDVMDREGARDTLVEVVCSALPAIANRVAKCARVEFEPSMVAPKPMSVFVQAKSPRNTFKYKSSFIQNTIVNASETWVNKPQTRRGIKRALNVEETPFICTPKLFKSKSLFAEQEGNESTPPKRAKLNLSGTPKTPKMSHTPRVSEKLTRQMAALLDMPDVQSPGYKCYTSRSGAETPQSILKTRRAEQERDAPSPVDSRYLADSDDELLDTASNHTHYSDSKHLRFTIPTESEAGSTPSPAQPVPATAHLYTITKQELKDNDEDEVPPILSPPKKLAVEEKTPPRKSYKDTVKARRSLSISANSSLSEDPNTSIESIADIPITLINPKYTSDRRHRETTPTEIEDTKYSSLREKEEAMDSSMEFSLPMPRTPKGRKSIRKVSIEVAVTPLLNRSRSATPERQDSPVVSSLLAGRRSRSRTPEPSPRAAPLAPIPELPRQERDEQPHPKATSLSVPTPLRSRSRTPDRKEAIQESPRLEPINESPTKTSHIDIPIRPSSRRSLRQRSKTPERIDKEVSEAPQMETIKESSAASSESPVSSPTRRSLRSRSRTPEVEIVPDQPSELTSPRNLRSRSKTPEKLMSPKKEGTRSKKSLSRIVLEANAFAKSKQVDKLETETETIDLVPDENEGGVIECTPMKPSKQPPSLMDVTFSPITNKSILQSSSESILSVSTEKINKPENESISGLKLLPAFTTINEMYVEKSVLHSYQSSIVETSSSYTSLREENIEKIDSLPNPSLKSLPPFNTLNETGFGKSVLKSFQSSMAESSREESKMEEVPKTYAALKSLNETEFGRSVLRSEDSSAAITSDESFAREPRDKALGTTSSKNMSSLITDDSDIEMKEGNSAWGRMESQDTARVIQKEKEKIVEIEREINEIEDDMSDDCRVEGETDSDEEQGEDDSENESVNESENDSENESENESENGSQNGTENESGDESENGSEIESEGSDKESSGENDSNNDDVVCISDESTPDSDNKLKIDESSSESSAKEMKTTDTQTEDKHDKVVEAIAEIEVEKAAIEKESVEAKVNEVAPTDPLNQLSMLTDDNSFVESESVNLNYSDENKPEKADEVKEVAEEQYVEMPAAQREIEIEMIVEETFSTTEDKKEKETPMVSKGIDVVDTMKTVQKLAEKKTMQRQENVDKFVTKETIKEAKPAEKEITKPEETDNKVVTKGTVKEVKSVKKEITQPEESGDKVVTERPVKETKSIEKEIMQPKEIDDKVTTEKPVIDEKSIEKEIIKPKESNGKPLHKETAKTVKEADTKFTTEAPEPEKMDEDIPDQTAQKDKAVSDDSGKVEPATPKSRKRTKSTSSNKSSEEKETKVSDKIETEAIEEPKTPRTRKRTQSTASNRSVTDEQKTEELETPEDKEVKTPSRGRSKTPSTEVRKILTRRASRELAEKLDDGARSPEEAVVTPRRRATRARSKNDDNASVASEGSVKSFRSKASEDSTDVKPSPVRKGRKSVLSTKPDLSVIPEAVAEESGVKDDETINEYSGSRRLTRTQKAALETWREPRAPRRRSAASRDSLEGDDEDASSTHSPAFDVQPIDRISLLNKNDYEGPPDEEEVRSVDSPTSFLSERPRNRLARAASESKSTPKAARITRKASADIVLEGGEGSPSRGRRASFTRACEALHTPRGRRASADLKKSEAGSQQGSPAPSEPEPATPARRARRTPSGTSLADTAGTKKTAVGKNKETKE